MADNNRPPSRKTNVTGSGKGVYRRGEGLGTGKVGTGSGTPGAKRPSGGSGGFGGFGGGSGKRPSGSSNTSDDRDYYSGGGTRSGGFKIPIIILILLLVFGGGGGALSGLFGGGGGGLLSNLFGGGTPANQPSSPVSQTIHSLNSLNPVSNLFSLGSSSSQPSTITQSGSATNNGTHKPATTPKPAATQPANQPATQAQTLNAWTQSSNNGVLNRNVATGARAKFTKILGNKRDTVTIMVWMCGADLESRSAMASRDLSEMASAKLNDNVRVIVCTGGAKTWHIQGISNSVHQIYRVDDGTLERLEDNFGGGSMTDEANLEAFIKYCRQNFPANRNMLIFWDHGGGSLQGYGYDETNSSKGTMTLAEINTALKNAKTTFDMIGFDTCLMATAENALMLSNYADYLVASEETEPGVGWYYTDWLTNLAANPSMATLDVGKNICDDFVTVCDQTCKGQKTTLSVVDLAELSTTMKSAFVDFSTSTSDLIDSDDYRAVSNARSSTREFSTNKIDQIDLIHFASNLGTKEAKSLANTLLSAIKYNRTNNMSNAYGMSIYFPYRASASNVSAAANIYDGIGLDDEYTDCIKNFASVAASGQAVSGGGYQNNPYSALQGGSSSSSYGQSSEDILQLLNMFMGGSGYSGGSSASQSISGALLNSLMQGRSMPVSDTAAYIAENSFDASKLVWQLYEDDYYRCVLDQSQWDLVQGLDLNMFYDDGEGYIDLGLDNVYWFDGYGNLIGATDGTWVSIDEQPVAYYHLSTSNEEDGGYTIMGYVPAMLNGEQVRLILYFTDEDPYGFVAGAQPVYGNESDSSAKGLIEIAEGDKIDFLCDYYRYDGSYDDSYYLGEQLVVSGDLKISNTYVGDDIYAMYRFTDIYGQYYWTEEIPE